MSRSDYINIKKFQHINTRCFVIDKNDMQIKYYYKIKNELKLLIIYINSILNYNRKKVN